MVFIEFLSTAYYPVPANPIAAMARLRTPHTTSQLNSYFYYFVLGSREPKNTVFQQNPIVAQAQLDAPMDSDAVIAAA